MSNFDLNNSSKLSYNIHNNHIKHLDSATSHFIKSNSSISSLHHVIQELVYNSIDANAKI